MLEQQIKGEITMATGQNNQLTRQIGEHLVTAELGRLGIIASPFAGYVQDIDLLAYKDGKAFPIQVKAICGGSWQFDVKKFVNVKIDGKKQIVGKIIVNNNRHLSHLLYVFVVIGSYGDDKFFVLEWSDLAEILIDNYKAYLDSHDGVRPKAHKSTHAAISPKDIAKYMVDVKDPKGQDKWMAMINANLEKY
jgi:predicted RecB family endonuclease